MGGAGLVVAVAVEGVEGVVEARAPQRRPGRRPGRRWCRRPGRSAARAGRRSPVTLVWSRSAFSRAGQGPQAARRRTARPSTRRACATAPPTAAAPPRPRRPRRRRRGEPASRSHARAARTPVRCSHAGPDGLDDGDAAAPQLDLRAEQRRAHPGQHHHVGRRRPGRPAPRPTASAVAPVTSPARSHRRGRRARPGRRPRSPWPPAGRCARAAGRWRPRRRAGSGS